MEELYPSFPRKPEPDQLWLSGEPREVAGERGTDVWLLAEVGG